MSEDGAPTDARIAEEIQRRGLEIEYLQELAAALGFSEMEPWTEEAFAAIERATAEQRRHAALRTLQLSAGHAEEEGERSMDEDRPPTETATVGGGCFWCTEAVFEALRGVERVEAGYAGGTLPNPTYEQVCSGTTGHAEVVRVTFRPAEISYRELLEIFFATHDPTTLNRQGADVGTQYRSVVIPQSGEQRRTAEEVIASLREQGVWEAPIVTTIEEAAEFYPAEAYHREYYRRNPGQGYCQVVIAPKVAKFRQKFADRLRDSDTGG